MLKNEPQDEAQGIPFVPAAQRRVSAEELNAALEALETTKREQARRDQEQVAIGQVVGELGLDVTPEEIWQQVQAQRAQKAAPPPPPPESKLADTVNETLHVMAQEAKKVAAQASAAAQEAIANAQAQQHARAKQAQQTAQQAAHIPRAAHFRGPRRHGRGGFWPVFVGLACIGYAVFASHNGLMTVGDHESVTYIGSHGVAVFAGDHDNITLRGNCGTLIVPGDHDTITITGTVKRIISPGDHNTIQWQPDSQSPSITDLGDGNNIQPASEIDSLPPITSPAHAIPPAAGPQ